MSLKRRKILVVDDASAMTTTLDTFLTAKGYDVTTAPDSRSAMAAFANQRPDLLLTDINLPDANGVKLMEIAKGAKPEIPVIMMTGLPDDSTAMHCLGMGASYLLKPFSMDQLAILVRDQLSSTEKKPKPFLEKKSLLVVDDDTQFVSVLSELFAHEGYRTFAAFDEEGALQTLRLNSISAVILDKHLGKEDGRKIAKRIKDIYPYAEIILTTGFGDTKDVSTLFPKIISNYLRKPCFIKKYLSTVEEALERRNSRINHLLQNSTPSLWAVAGPRGSGKTVAIDLMTKMLPYTHKFVRHTTRAPRENEIEGDDHYFVTEATFNDKKERFFYVGGHKNYKIGFEKGVVEEKMAEGRDVLFTFTNFDSFEATKLMYPSMKLILMLADPRQTLEWTKNRVGQSKTSLDESCAEFDKFFGLINDAAVYIVNSDPIQKADAEKVLGYNVYQNLEKIVRTLSNVVDLGRR